MCSVIVTFEKEGKIKKVELCSFGEAFVYAKGVVMKNGHKLISIERGAEYNN